MMLLMITQNDTIKHDRSAMNLVQRRGINMNYEEFRNQYISLIKTMFQYTPNQVGSQIFAEKLSDLTESVPKEWIERADESF